MAQKNRTKEIWLIPKRVNLHQTICLIDGLTERNYDGTSWTPQKQNNLGVNLKRWGATKSGKNISSQAIRTLVASIPQYLGFLYINTDSTPNTICLSKAGRSLLQKHKAQLEEVPNLGKGKNLLVTESQVVLQQMEKLQITNPVISKDCENISVFPFRFLLKVLLKTNYLDKEEIAYFLFKVKNENEVDQTVRKIEDFRRMPEENRKDLMKAFKGTQIGSITLDKASSAGYFMSLCQITGIIDRVKITPDNRKTAIAGLKIKDDRMKYVKAILLKYQQVETYDFKDNLQLWIDYMGDPQRDYPPIDVSVINQGNADFLIQIYKDGCCKYDDLIHEKETLKIPMFVNEAYDVKVIDIATANELETLHITPTFKQREFEMKGSAGKQNIAAETLEEIAKETLAHCGAKNFAGKTFIYLNTLSKITGVDKTEDKSLRGAYLEYYVYKMLCILKDEKVVDEVSWNGKMGKYGLPVQAPGGKTGKPDMVFVVDDVSIVVELTTIKSKAMQFSAEGSSVPDHIRLYQQDSGKKVVGVFCAPMIHERNTAAMQSTIAPYGTELYCITIEELVELLLSRDRKRIALHFPLSDSGK